MPQTSKQIFRNKGISPRYYRKYKRKINTFQALPRLKNNLSCDSDNIWSESKLFQNPGPVLVFNSDINKKYNLGFEFHDKNKRKYPCDYHSLPMLIEHYFNNYSHDNKLSTERWAKSHLVFTEDFVAIDKDLACILIYNTDQYKDIYDNSDSYYQLRGLYDIPIVKLYPKQSLTFSQLYDTIKTEEMFYHKGK